MSKGHARVDAATQAVAEAAALRGLIREAHEAMQDLRALVREAAALRLVALAETGAQLDDYARELQADLNRNTAELAGHVEEARDHIMSALTVAHLELSHGGKGLRVHWGGPNFGPPTAEEIAARQRALAEARGEL